MSSLLMPQQLRYTAKNIRLILESTPSSNLFAVHIYSTHLCNRSSWISRTSASLIYLVKPQIRWVKVVYHTILTSFSFFILLLQEEQRGSIGITLDSQWHEPLTNSSEDADAAERMQLFAAGWWGDKSISYHDTVFVRNVLSESVKIVLLYEIVGKFEFWVQHTEVHLVFIYFQVFRPNLFWRLSGGHAYLARWSVTQIHQGGICTCEGLSRLCGNEPLHQCICHRSTCWRYCISWSILCGPKNSASL